MHERRTLGLPDQSTLESLGDRWSLIVIRDVMFGSRRHFRKLLTRSEERITSNMLADRLTRLEKARLVSISRHRVRRVSKGLPIEWLHLSVVRHHCDVSCHAIGLVSAKQ